MAKYTIKKWLKDLRSGKFNQIEGQLKGTTDDGKVGFCCLGVYTLGHCKALKKGFTVKGIGTFPEFGMDHFQPETKIGKIADSQGLTKQRCQAYAKMNDEGATFKKIANKIEKDFGVKK